MEPWAAELFKKHVATNGALDPVARCQPAGEPSQPEIPLPYKIVQTPRLILVLYEENSIHRQIFLDGRKMVPEAEPRFSGYSTGRWEGDTLVVETAGFNDRTWLDRLGHPHSDAMRLTERFRRRDAGHLEVDVTITDPEGVSNAHHVQAAGHLATRRGPARVTSAPRTRRACSASDPSPPLTRDDCHGLILQTSGLSQRVRLHHGEGCARGHRVRHDGVRRDARTPLRRPGRPHHARRDAD